MAASMNPELNNVNHDRALIPTQFDVAAAHGRDCRFPGRLPLASLFSGV
jgi:hypothetical protein